MIVEFLELTFSRHETCNLLCDTCLALARFSPTRRYTGVIELSIAGRESEIFVRVAEVANVVTLTCCCDDTRC